MEIKTFLKELLGIYNIDKRANRLFHKKCRLYQRGGLINRYRVIRIENYLEEKYGLKIPSTVSIGKNFHIHHPYGIRIGMTAIIGNNCHVYPRFAVVAAVKGDEARILNHERRHAKIGDDCILGHSAILIGPIEIGDDVTIGACAIVTKNVPSHSVVKGLNQIRSKRDDEIPEKYKIVE